MTWAFIRIYFPYVICIIVCRHLIIKTLIKNDLCKILYFFIS